MNLTYIIRRSPLRLICFFVLGLLSNSAESKPIVFNERPEKVIIGKDLEILVDHSGHSTIENVINEGKFKFSDQTAPVFFLNKETLWGRISVVNQ